MRSKILGVTFFIGLVVTSGAKPESLSGMDKQVLLKKLEEIKTAAEKSSKDRFATAMKAFRAAVKSDVAAHDLYLKCVEKVDFTDQKRSSQDFREWKRRHKETRNTLEFRRALQHQLNWLLLSIEASANPDDIQSLGQSALDKVDAIMQDHEMLKPHRGILQQGVLQTVYARAYNINGLKADKWPNSPLQIEAIYNELIFPPLRNKSSINHLRSAWDKRIEHEGLILKNWGTPAESAKIGMKRDAQTLEYIKWRETDYPELLWQKELDCYASGDEKQAAAAMLKHLGQFIKHKQSLKWTGEFEMLMSPRAGESASESFQKPEE